MSAGVVCGGGEWLGKHSLSLLTADINIFLEA